MVQQIVFISTILLVISTNALDITDAMLKQSIDAGDLTSIEQMVSNFNALPAEERNSRLQQMQQLEPFFALLDKAEKREQRKLFSLWATTGGSFFIFLGILPFADTATKAIIAISFCMLGSSLFGTSLYRTLTKHWKGEDRIETIRCLLKSMKNSDATTPV